MSSAMSQQTNQMQRPKNVVIVSNSSPDCPNHWILWLEWNLSVNEFHVDAHCKTIARYCSSYVPDSNSYTMSRRLKGGWRSSRREIWANRCYWSLLIVQLRDKALSNFHRTRSGQHLVAPATDHFKAAAAAAARSLLAARRTRAGRDLLSSALSYGYSHLADYSCKHQRHRRRRASLCRCAPSSGKLRKS